MKTKLVTLAEPVIVAGKELTEVAVRRSTVGDEEDAMQQALSLKRGANNVTVEFCLMSKLTRLPYDAIRSMSGPEYQKLKDAANELNGVSGSENPTRTDGTETPNSPGSGGQSSFLPDTAAGQETTCGA